MSKSPLLVAGAAVLLVVVMARLAHERNTARSPQQHFAQSEMFQSHGKTGEAIREMRAAIDADPRYFEARLGLSDLYLSINRGTEATQTLQEGIQASPRQSERYHYAICQAYLTMHDLPRALSEARLAAEEAPNDRQNQRMFAMLLEQSGQTSEAEKQWIIYSHRFPSDTSGARGLRRVRHLLNHSRMPSVKLPPGG